jgi:3-oxoacyl-[acyl-carrier protein] reductase
MKTAFITGAGGGIGSALVEKFISKGFFVIGQYNSNESGINKIRDELEKIGKVEYFHAVKCDFRNSDEVIKMTESVLKSFPHIDVLINNAGVGLYKLITFVTEEEWDDIFAVNIKSAHLITQRVLKGMIDKKYGKIVNVASVWGKVGASMEVAYSASKSALIGYTKALAKEVAPSGVNVNCVCPGVIDTPINAHLSKEDMKALEEETPLGRIGDKKDVAELVYFLSDKKSDFITGQIITCDGGFTL